MIIKYISLLKLNYTNKKYDQFTSIQTTPANTYIGVHMYGEVNYIDIFN